MLLCHLHLNLGIGNNMLDLDNINVDTQTKYIDSKQRGTPIIANEHGSLNNLLDIVLCKGFNESIINSITLDPETSIATVFLAQNHKYTYSQVVLISGANESCFNNEFRVLEARTSYIKIYIPGQNVTSATSSTGLKIKVAPLGYSLVFKSKLGSTYCFKNKSTKSPAILKVIDELPPNGYLTTWAKYARVSVGKAIDASGDFINNEKAPFLSDWPNVEKTGNTVKGSAGIHGYAKWDYAFSTATNNNYWREYNVVDERVREWQLIGDGNTFYLMIAPEGDTLYKSLTGFGNYISDNPLEDSNICLQARQGFQAASGYYSTSSYKSRDGNYFGRLSYDVGTFLYSNIYGRTNINDYRYSTSGLLVNLSFNEPWKSSSITNYNPVSGQILTSRLGIKDADNYVRGYHRGIKIFYGNPYLPAGSASPKGDLVLACSDPSGGGIVPMLFTLKDWEPV